MKRTLKLIYKLKVQGKSIRTIKKELFHIYDIYEKEKFIASIVRKIGYTKSKYSSIEIKKIMYLYSNFFDTEYLVKYLNMKYGYDLTYNRLIDLAVRNRVTKKKQNMYKQSLISRSDEFEIIELYKNGLTASEIAKKYGYKRKESIYSKLEKFNVKRRDWNVEQGKRLGLFNRKTFSDRIPVLKEKELEFSSYILRGAIDGDGWIRKDGLEFFICSASKEMIYWYKTIMERIGFIDLKVVFIKNKWNGIYQIRTGIKYNIYILKNKVYDKEFGMQRKYKLLL